MNIHALQTYSAMAEAQEIMATPHQIVSPQSNSVLIGLVQDALVGGFLMTSQNTF
jgi:DNA-directed RNA polymerase II subunit RPB1